MGSVTTVEAAHGLFHPAGVYLNTASSGLPPDPSWEALQITWAQYRNGTADVPGYDVPLEHARREYARLVGADVDRVAAGNQVSVFLGTVAGCLPDGAEILVAEGDFTSVTFPFVAAGRFTVREVPLVELAEAVTSSTTAVAVAAVQSVDGTVADLAAIRTACADAGALTIIDVTQAAGWYPFRADDFDVTVCSGYKWLLAPRGTGFMTVSDAMLERIVPLSANWYAGEDRWSSIYGLPLRLAASARRFDISPAWHSWVGAAPSLELLVDIGVDALHRHAVGLTDDFRSAVGLAPGGSAITALDLLPGAEERVMAAGIAGAIRAGRLRLSFHLNNSAADVETAADALRSRVRTD